MIVDIDENAGFLAQIQQSLLGEIWPNVRVISVAGSTKDGFTLRWYFDKSPNESEIESVMISETELIYTTPDHIEIRSEIIHFPTPNLVPKTDLWVYARHGL